MRWAKTTWLPTLPGFQEQNESCSLFTFTGLISPFIISSERSFLRYNALFEEYQHYKFWVFTQPNDTVLELLYKKLQNLEDVVVDQMP